MAPLYLLESRARAPRHREGRQHVFGSIPIAIQDAVREEVIDRPMRIFAPGFGAGAVAGYVVARIDPAIVAVSFAGDRLTPLPRSPRAAEKGPGALEPGTA